MTNCTNAGWNKTSVFLALVTKDEVDDYNFHYAPFGNSHMQDNTKQNEGAPMQLPNKENSAESFALPCSIGTSSLSALADLGSRINVMPLSLFLSLKMMNLKETNLVIEMTNMTRATPVGVVDNVIMRIDRFLFLVDFVVINMANIPNEDLILRRLFLATVRARTDVFMKEISLGVYEERITFKMRKALLSEDKEVASLCMASIEDEEIPPITIEVSEDIFNYITLSCLKYTHEVCEKLEGGLNSLPLFNFKLVVSNIHF